MSTIKELFDAYNDAVLQTALEHNAHKSLCILDLDDARDDDVRTIEIVLCLSKLVPDAPYQVRNDAALQALIEPIIKTRRVFFGTWSDNSVILFNIRKENLDQLSTELNELEQEILAALKEKGATV